MDLIKEEVSRWKDQVADSLRTPRSEMDSLIFQWSRPAEDKSGDDGDAADTKPVGDVDAGYLQIDEATWEKVAEEYIGASERK